LKEQLIIFPRFVDDRTLNISPHAATLAEVAQPAYSHTNDNDNDARLRTTVTRPIQGVPDPVHNPATPKRASATIPRQQQTVTQRAPGGAGIAAASVVA
jgi:hypothetical protein